MRSLVAAVLLLVGALLVPVATVAFWADTTLLPSGAYVDTVAPLATDPAVNAAVQNRLVDATMTAAAHGLPGLPAPLREAARPLVRRGAAVAVSSPAFAQVWRQANRDVHAQVVDVLAGHGPVHSSNGRVELSLRPLTTVLRQRLTAAGVPFAQQLPQTDATLPLGSTSALARARTGYRLLDRYGPLVPFAAVVLIALGLIAARRRGPALAGTAVVGLLGLGAVALALVAGRTVYLDRLPVGISRPAAASVYDTITAGLRTDLLVVAVVLAVAFVVGLLLGRRA